MTARQPRLAEPAYRRLAQRQAHRGQVLLGAMTTATALLSAGIQIARGVDAPSIAWAAAMAGLFLASWLLAVRAPRRLPGLAIGGIGIAAVGSTIGSELFTPLMPYPQTLGLVGLMPIGVAVFAGWGMREHAVWAAVSSALLGVLLLLGQASPYLKDAALPVALGWAGGLFFGTLAQQSLERGRLALYRSAKRAHLARRADARSLRQLHALEAIGRALSDRGPTTETLLAAMRMLVDVFGYAHPSIYLGDDQTVRLGAQLGYPGLLETITRDTGIVGRVMRTHRPVLLEDTAGDPGYRRVTPDDRSEVCVPLLAGDRFLGVLNVESGRRLGPDDLASVSIVGDRLAAALDIADRRATLERFLDASPVAITAFAPDATVAYWNRAAAELFGWSPAEVVGQPSPAIDPDNEASGAVESAIGMGRAVGGTEGLRRHRDGHLIPVRIYAAPFGERPPFGAIAVYRDLTAERAASAALTESEARFETVVGALREGVIVQDSELKSVWINAAAERILGVSAAQLAGEAPWDERWEVFREDGSRVDAHDFPGASALRTGTPVLGATFSIRHPDGDVRWVEANALLLRRDAEDAPYAVVTSLSDVTERRRHEDELARAELHVRTVLEQSSNAIVGVDEAGLITYANPRAEAVLGWRPEDLIGQSVEVLVPDGLVDKHVVLRRRYEERRLPRPTGIGMEITARRRDGSEFPVEIGLSPVDTPSGRQTFATITDVTERRRAESELLQAAKMDSIGRLAGGIAHDFNNLLTAIIGYGEMAITDLPMDHPVRGEVTEMVKAAERASGLTRQLLGFARKSVLTPATHDLNDIVSGLTPFLSRLLGERIALVTNLAAGPAHVRVDRSQVDQILVNLAVNARDAMRGGGTLVIETHSVAAHEVADVLHVAAERVALLVVSDTGAGMSDEVRSRIFEPFFTTKPFGEGTGLGLATTYGIVRSSGGTITVDSQLGAGTTFRIYLPEVEPVEAAEADARRPQPAPGSRRTVLVVEDEESVRALATRLLERAGYHVLQAPNGEAAVSLIGARLDEVDLLLSDIVMPGMRGPELYEVLRTARPDLPAVFMSGYSADEPGEPEARHRALLEKPFTSDGLLAAVAEALR